MKRFDLYRLTLAYLGFVFALCALVVFEPFRGVWPAETEQDLAGSVEADLPPDAAEAETAAPRGEVWTTVERPALQHSDPAEVVAALVAQSFGLELEEELGEGDASAQSVLGLTTQEALVARGSDVAYTVGPDETLGSLALRFYGDSALAPMIYDANRGLMASPDNLRVGQVVIIPGRS